MGPIMREPGLLAEEHRIVVLCPDGSRVEGMWMVEPHILALIAQLNDLPSVPTLCVQTSTTSAMYIPNHVLVRSKVMLQVRSTERETNSGS